VNGVTRDYIIRPYHVLAESAEQSHLMRHGEQAAAHDNQNTSHQFLFFRTIQAAGPRRGREIRLKFSNECKGRSPSPEWHAGAKIAAACVT